MAGGAWASPHGAGRSRIYPAAEIERLKGEQPAAHAGVPEGYVDQAGACRTFGLSAQTWRTWTREGKLPPGEWGRSPTNKPCRVDPVEELRRVIAGIRSPDRAYREPGKGTYHLPEGFVRGHDAWRMFGVDHATWYRWECEGRIACGVRVDGCGPKVYPRESLDLLLAECGRYAPPDPDRPGVYRVPLTGRGMHRREAIIDAADLPLVGGKRWCWSGKRPGQPGQVVISGKDTTLRLRQVIVGVSGTERRVGHRNGDPLDCRRENLFVRSRQEQGRGAKKKALYAGRPSSSRYKGVCFEKWTGKWRAAIVVDGKALRLGRFRDELAAAEAYEEAARELFGEHARLNFPEGVDAWLEREAAPAAADAAAEAPAAARAA